MKFSECMARLWDKGEIWSYAIIIVVGLTRRTRRAQTRDVFEDSIFEAEAKDFMLLHDSYYYYYYY